MPPSIIFLLSFLSLASSVVGYEYDGDSFTTASLAITCVYASFFVVLIVLCAINLGITRDHRLPYICLLVSLVFSFISAIAHIVYYVVTVNGERNATPPGSTIVAMLAMQEFFGDCALPFLFISFCLLLRVRFLINGVSEGHTRSLNPIWTITYITIWALLLIFGATLTGLYTNYNNAIFLPINRIDLTVGELGRMLNALYAAYSGVLYTYDAILYSSAFVVGGLAIHTCKATQRSRVVDKMTKMLVYVALPLYVCLMIENIIFTILFSPSGLKLDIFNQDPRKSASVASLILANGFYSAVALVLIICGMRRSNWTMNSQTSHKEWDDAYPLPNRTNSEAHLNGL